MKEFKNKKTAIDENKVDYIELCRTCINSPLSEGYTIDDMSKRIKILDVLEKSNGKVSLEDADFELLKSLVLKQKWAIIHKDLVEFHETIKEL